MKPDLTLSETQALAYELFEDPQVVHLLFGGGAGSGKRLSVDTLIPTPKGFKYNGDLKDGDVVFAPDGTQTKVLKAHPVQLGDSYRVFFDDGTCIECDAEHLWYVESNGKGSVKTTLEIKESKETYSIPNTKPIECEEWKDSANPYMVGLVNRGGGEIHPYFLRGSIEQREEILSGLMKKLPGEKAIRGEFHSGSYRAFENFRELLASLGIKSHNNRGSITFDREEENADRRFITSIEKIDDIEMRCITVDHPSHMYLCGRQMVPTHNTFILGLLLALACKKYPNTRWGLARKELKSLKQTTLATLLAKVHPALGITESDYRMNLLESTLEYVNGSQVLLLDLTAKPSDPEMESLGSLELTGAFIDEAGEVTKKAYDILASRVNRWMNEEYGITGRVTSSCNPTPGFVRQEFYDKYDALGGGRMQKWKTGKVWVNGEQLDAYSAYVRSTALDNPFISRNYIEQLRRLPPQEKKRLLDGDWNYTDEDDSLFPMKLIDKMTVYEMPEPELTPKGEEKFNKFIGVDPSDSGKDDTVATLIENGVIREQVEIKSPDGKDAVISMFIAGKVIEFAEKHGFTAPLARNITIEGNGIGAALRDSLKTLGWNVNVYTATLQSRSEGYYKFMTDANDDKIKIWHEVVEKGLLVRQLSAHKYDLDTGKPRITNKKALRTVLGRSPDHADSAMIAAMAYRSKPKAVSSYIRW